MPNPSVLAFVDTHGAVSSELKRKIRKEKPDAVVCAGDFTIFSREMEKKLREISKLHKKVFLVHGNHEHRGEVALLCKKYNVRFIHQKVVMFGKIVFVGYGGGGFAQRDPTLEEWTTEIKKKVRAYKKKGKSIFVVAHAPFYKTALDKLYGSYLGSKSLRKLILAVKADFAVCGHFHENAGKEDKIRQCRVLNPGAKGLMVSLREPGEGHRDSVRD
ncbi:MAG: metallophosphoesterase [Nanoarchaeota archaeon]|nr:metallophosphoesterase [Nanoarchaeota archaeon]